MRWLALFILLIPTPAEAVKVIRVKYMGGMDLPGFNSAADVKRAIEQQVFQPVEAVIDVDFVVVNPNEKSDYRIRGVNYVTDAVLDYNPQAKEVTCYKPATDNWKLTVVRGILHELVGHGMCDWGHSGDPSAIMYVGPKPTLPRPLFFTDKEVQRLQKKFGTPGGVEPPEEEDPPYRAISRLDKTIRQFEKELRKTGKYTDSGRSALQNVRDALIRERDKLLVP